MVGRNTPAEPVRSTAFSSSESKASSVLGGGVIDWSLALLARAAFHAAVHRVAIVLLLGW